MDAEGAASSPRPCRRRSRRPRLRHSRWPTRGRLHCCRGPQRCEGRRGERASVWRAMVGVRCGGAVSKRDWRARARCGGRCCEAGLTSHLAWRRGRGGALTGPPGGAADASLGAIASPTHWTQNTRRRAACRGMLAVGWRRKPPADAPCGSCHPWCQAARQGRGRQGKSACASVVASPPLDAIDACGSVPRLLRGHPHPCLRPPSALAVATGRGTDALPVTATVVRQLRRGTTGGRHAGRCQRRPCR